MAGDAGTVLIPALGESARFRDVGYIGPKALLPIGTPDGEVDTMIGRVVRHYPAGWDIRVIAPKDHAEAIERAVRRTRPFGRVDVLPVIGRTQGQSATVLLGLVHSRINLDRPVIVNNCDVALRAPVPTSLSEMPRSTILVHSDDPSGPPIYSYVETASTSGSPLALRVQEKARFDCERQAAQTGVWLFRDPRSLVIRINDQKFQDLRVNGELYLSGAVDLMARARELDCLWVDQDQFLDMGTPEAIARGGMEILA
jgi:hypothetical protein